MDAYISAGAFDRAEPLLVSIVAQLREDRKLKDVVRFLHLQGKLAEQKGDLDAAFEAYEGVHKVDASYIPNLLSLGRMLYRREDWDGALKMFQTLLLHQMNIDQDQDKVDVYYHLGMVRWHQGDPRRAKDMFSRALSIDAKHEPTKQALSQL
ncbi:MAG: tetratricopeptide repeat protein [bacterium]